MLTDKGHISKAERLRLEAEGLIPHFFGGLRGVLEEDIIYFGEMPALEWTKAEKERWEARLR
jgi:hypothetical protein